MTMLDDDRLASLFARAGASFDVPATGPDDIVARATGRVATAGADGDGDATATSIAPTRVTATTGRRRRVVACAAWPAWRAGTASSRSPPASWSCSC